MFARRRLGLCMAEQFTNHGQALAERQAVRRELLSEIVNPDRVGANPFVLYPNPKYPAVFGIAPILTSVIACVRHKLPLLR